MVEEARLESVYTPKGYRGFESPSLRKNEKAVANLNGCDGLFRCAPPAAAPRRQGIAASGSKKNRGKLRLKLAAAFVGVPGLEPGKTGPESVVLPLHHTPMAWIICGIPDALSITAAKVGVIRETTKFFRHFFVFSLKIGARAVLEPSRIPVKITKNPTFRYAHFNNRRNPLNFADNYYRTYFRMSDTTSLVNSIVKGIQEKKGYNIVTVDLRKIETAPCEFFVLCTGNAPQHVEAINDAMWDYVRVNAGEKPAATAGLGQSEWVAVDYGTVMVHIFVPATRAYYDLEHLWGDAVLTQVPDLD